MNPEPVPTDALTVEFDRSLEDLVAFNLLVFRKSGVEARQLRAWNIFNAVCVLVPVAAVAWYTKQILLALALAIVGMASVLLLFPSYFRFWIRRSVVRNVKLMHGATEPTHHRIALGTDGVRDDSSAGVSITPWASVPDVIQGDGRIYLFTSPTTAHILPGAAFASEDARDAFLAEVRRRRSVSR